MAVFIQNTIETLNLVLGNLYVLVTPFTAVSKKYVFTSVNRKQAKRIIKHLIFPSLPLQIKGFCMSSSHIEQKRLQSMFLKRDCHYH